MTEPTAGFASDIDRPRELTGARTRCPADPDQMPDDQRPPHYRTGNRERPIGSTGTMSGPPRIGTSVRLELMGHAYRQTPMRRRRTLLVRRMLAVFAVVGALGGCVADDESTSAAPRSEATLTIRREMPAGPIWEEGSTMVVRVFEERRLVREVQAGDGYYEPDLAVISLPPGTYRVKRPRFDAASF